MKLQSNRGDEGGLSPWDPFGRSPRQRLERFLVADIPVSSAGGLLVLGVFLLVKHNAYLWVLAGGTFVNSAVGLWALGRTRAGQLESAVVGLCLSLWVMAIVDVAIAPALLPCFVALITLGAILAVPYMPRPSLRAVLGASTTVVFVVAVLGRAQDFTRLTAQVPGWIISTFIVAGLLVTVALTTVSLLHYRANLVDAYDELKASAVELEASCRRLVAASDGERRRIERDLHDGAQQTLMAIMLRARSGRYRAEELERDLQDAIDELRKLAHGIYPPLLAEQGLDAAMHVAAERALVPMRLSCEQVGRYDPEVETAVYFCCLEALQNVAKHAGRDAKASVHLWGEPRWLCFSITDDGVGFADGSVRDGAGLINMRDRVGSLGGRLEIASSPRQGTEVRGSVPVRPVRRVAGARPTS